MFAMVMKAMMMSDPTMYPWAQASTTSAFCWVGMGLCPATLGETSRRIGLIAVVAAFADAEVDVSCFVMFFLHDGLNKHVQKQTSRGVRR